MQQGTAPEIRERMEEKFGYGGCGAATEQKKTEAICRGLKKFMNFSVDSGCLRGTKMLYCRIREGMGLTSPWTRRR